MRRLILFVSRMGLRPVFFDLLSVSSILLVRGRYEEDRPGGLSYFFISESSCFTAASSWVSLPV